jgi:hypothetical protein
LNEIEFQELLHKTRTWLGKSLHVGQNCFEP